MAEIVPLLLRLLIISGCGVYLLMLHVLNLSFMDYLFFSVPAPPLPDPLQPKVPNNPLYPQASALTTRVVPPHYEHLNDQHVNFLQGKQEEP